jgi:membrane protease YdiL (CAAX protease family)
MEKYKFLLLFIFIAFAISLPIHLGYYNGVLKQITGKSIFSNMLYLFACLGPLIAGSVLLMAQPNVSTQISILGEEKLKNIVFVLVPIVAFSISGLTNSYGKDIHYFGFLYAVINVAYAFAEEFGWRLYLQNSLENENKNFKYILIAVIWWLWHMRFSSQFEFFIFPLIIIGGGILLGMLADQTKSVLPVVAIHVLIIMLTNSGPIDRHKMMAGLITVASWILIGIVWKK